MGTNWSASGSGASRHYSYTATAAEPAAATVTAANNAGRAADSTFTVTADTSAPTGQTISLQGTHAPYFPSTVAWTLGGGSDTGSGVDSTTALVTRETATLAGDSCTGWSNDSGSFSSPDATVAGGHCYRYTFTIADRVGNVSTGVTVTAKVDTTDPNVAVAAPTATAGTGAQSYDAPTKTLYFNPAASGSFTLAATATDAQSDVTSAAFPDLSGVSGWTGSGGTDTSSPYASSNYSWSSGATAPGSRNILGTNGAGATASVTIRTDPKLLGRENDTATVRANEVDPQPANNSATASTLVVLSLL